MLRNNLRIKIDFGQIWSRNIGPLFIALITRMRHCLKEYTNNAKHILMLSWFALGYYYKTTNSNHMKFNLTDNGIIIPIILTFQCDRMSLK